MKSRTLAPLLAALATSAALCVAACDDSSGVTPDPPASAGASASVTSPATAVATGAPTTLARTDPSAQASTTTSAPAVPSMTAATPEPTAEPSADKPKPTVKKPKPKKPESGARKPENTADKPKPTADKPEPTAKVAPTAAPSASAQHAGGSAQAVSPPVTTATPTATATTEPPAPAPAKTVKLEPAKPGTADYVAQEVDKIYLPIKRFRARFKQEYYAKVSGTTKNSNGVCYVERPGKVSFSYHEPNKNRVVSDGTLLKIYEHENKQMFIKKVAHTEYPGALAFIMGKGLRQSFVFSFHDKSKWEGGAVIIGTPRVANPAYKKVLFYIDKKLLEKGDPGCVRRVLVMDAQGNRNRFDFLHTEQPASIKPSEFTFDPPPGTNILK